MQNTEKYHYKNYNHNHQPSALIGQTCEFTRTLLISGTGHCVYILLSLVVISENKHALNQVKQQKCRNN